MSTNAASDIEVQVHETYVEISVSRVDPAEPDAEAYVWVCACGDGGEDADHTEVRREARRHERIAG